MQASVPGLSACNHIAQLESRKVGVRAKDGTLASSKVVLTSRSARVLVLALCSAGSMGVV